MIVFIISAPSGSGKSTLVKILGGVYSKDRGSIFVNQAEVDIPNPTRASARQTSGRTAMVAESARFPLLYARGAAQLTAGIILSVMLAAGLSWMLHRTWFGFHLRAVGGNPTAAASARVLERRSAWRWHCAT